MENTKGSAALARIGEDAGPYEPRDFSQAMEMASQFASAKLTKCRTKEQAFLVMATGRELGVPATTALRMMYVADFGQGEQVVLSADLMVGLCLRASSVCEYFRCTESTPESATYATKRRGDPERTCTFTTGDKERAKLGLVKEGKDAGSSNWAKYPAVMLRHRAASILAREVYPDVIGGFYTEDEAREVGPDAGGPARPVTPLRPPGEKVIDGEFSEVPKDKAPPPPNVADFTRRFRAATSQQEGDAIQREAVKLFDKGTPEREALKAVISERKAAGWAPVTEEAEPPHDPNTGEVLEPGAGG